MALRYYIFDKATQHTDLLTRDEFLHFASLGYDNAEAIVVRAEEQALDTGASNPIELTFTILRIEDHD